MLARPVPSLGVAGIALLALALAVLAIVWSPERAPTPLLVADLRGHALVVLDPADPAAARRIPLPGGPHELLRALGAMPIDRNSPKDLVQQSIDQFVNNEKMVIIVAPEGTRDGASQWKSGFWRIAKGAGVPVIIATADYRKKEIAFPGMVMPGDDMAADMVSILECYRGVEPRHPQRLSAPLAAMRKAEGDNV